MMPSDADRDRMLAELLNQLSDRRRRGEPADISAIASAHPELTAELRQLWAAHELAEVLGRTRSFQVNAAISASVASGELPPPFDDYELLQELGRGGMGVVYLAKQKSLDRLVALKMIVSGAFASQNDRDRFRAEAESAARLVHPNIVTVYQIGEHSGRPYFAMQYVHGENLAARLRRGPIPPREAARLIAALTRGVHHAHERGIIHRDLKPSNILLSAVGDRLSASNSADWLNAESRRPIAESQEPKVTDFGLARRVDGPSLTTTGQILGTPSYMAPEQAAGRKDVGAATDIHALGAILYECLTGRPPFQAALPFDTLMQVLEQEPVPPRILNPAVPRELESIVIKCLEKSPGRRYASAASLAADLDAYLNNEPISATPSGLGYYLDRIFRETHHAEVLENWGLLWMWHSLAIFTLCFVTQLMQWSGWPTLHNHLAYVTLWGVGLVTWGAIFWSLRKRGGPVRFVERQVAHAWAAGLCASVGLFIIEVLMQQPPLSFSPILAVAAGMVFLFKAGVLAGIFYIAAVVLFFTAVLMALFPQCGVLLFGLAAAGCFFFPGLKYYRQSRRITRQAL